MKTAASSSAPMDQAGFPSHHMDEQYVGQLEYAGESSPKKASRKKKDRDHSTLRKAPQAPKRFKSSYICFFMAKQGEIKEELGEAATVSEVSKRSAEMWRSLTAEERAHWNDVAAKDKQRYMLEKATYTGPWQVPWKRARKDPSAPKRPMSAFLYFSQDKRRHIKAENPSMRNTEVSRKLGDLWRNASEEERAPHIEKEKGEREKYKSLIAEWRKEHEEKMEEQKKAQAKAQAEHAAQLASMYNAATANVTSNEQEQTQYNYPPGGYGDANVMQQQPQYMGQHQHQAHASLYGYASSYPPYGSMPYGGYPPSSNAPQAPHGIINGRPVMVLGPTGMPVFSQASYEGQSNQSTGPGYEGGTSQPHYDPSDYPSQE